MNFIFFNGLLQNVAMLLSFSMLYEHFWLKHKHNHWIEKTISGFMIGIIGVVLMMTPWQITPGIVFDTRSILLSISGLFFGFIPTVIAMIFTTLYRIYLSGDGIFMGIAVIISSGTIGIVWREVSTYWSTKNKNWELPLMSIIVHLIMFSCVIFLPIEKRLTTLKDILIPLILVYIPATVLLGFLMLNMKKNFENRKAKEKVQELERRFKELLQSVNLLSLILDKEGNVIFCNKYLLTVTGYQAKEVIGTNWYELFIPMSIKNQLKSKFSSAKNENDFSKNYENEIITKSGELLSISWNNTILYDSKNNIIGYASIGENITLRRIAEQNLLDAKLKAEMSDKLKTAFLANISHEIRTPMNGILGFADLLKTTDLGTEKQEKYIQIIQQSGERMLNIINDIVDISKIESGHVTINYHKININELMQHLYLFFLPEAQNKGIKLSLNGLLLESQSIIETDSVKLSQILSNLLKNALKFTPKGFINFGCNNKDSFLEFYVQDSGIGIPDHLKEAVFDRFRQGDISLSRAYEGAGLGLSISKAYVDMLGGNIGLHSEQGQGTNFYFTIPNLPVNNLDQDVHISEKLLSDLSNTIILIVDDDSFSLDYLKTILERKNAIVFTASNGKDALSIIENNSSIQIILMDLKMPEMDGFEATKSIKTTHNSIKIIAQTAYAFSDYNIRAKDVGCDAFITKPINEKILLENIQELLNLN